MTSYVPLLLKGNVYPIKVGGKTKDEPQTPMSKETEARLIKAFKEGDKKTLKELRLRSINRQSLTSGRHGKPGFQKKYLILFLFQRKSYHLSSGLIKYCQFPSNKSRNMVSLQKNKLKNQRQN